MNRLLNWLETIAPNVWAIPDRILQSTWQTIYMTLIAAVIAGTIGITFGVILVITNRRGILEKPRLYNKLEQFINTGVPSIYYSDGSARTFHSLYCRDDDWNDRCHCAPNYRDYSFLFTSG